MTAEKTSITAEEVISNTLANWPRTVDAAKLRDELSAAGYKIVPREPTAPMLEIGNHIRSGTHDGARYLQDIYRAMWDAAS